MNIWCTLVLKFRGIWLWSPFFITLFVQSLKKISVKLHALIFAYVKFILWIDKPVIQKKFQINEIKDFFSHLFHVYSWIIFYERFCVLHEPIKPFCILAYIYVWILTIYKPNCLHIFCQSQLVVSCTFFILKSIYKYNINSI